jgi:hypothetical protein
LKLKIVAVIAIFSLVSIVCFAIYGYSGIDYRYHLTSWLDYSAAWKSGVLYPAWAARANFGLGEPRFYFYPPFSLWFGSLLTLLLPLKIVPGIFTWITFCLAGFSMYLLSGLFLPERDRLKAAVLYCLSYYLLISASKHFAMAELLTDAFLPIICFFFLKVLFEEKLSAFIGLTVCLALSWQTDIPAAVDIGYTLFIGACIYLAWKGRIRPFLMYLGAQVLSLLLSAWYLLPAFLAKKQIGSDRYLAYDFRYLFAHTSSAFLDETLSTLTVLTTLILIFCLFRLRQNTEKKDSIRILIYFGLIAFFFQLPFTHYLWDHLPELRIVGFPFRFQIFLAIALPLAVLVLPSAQRLRAFVFALYGVFAVFPLWSYWAWVRTHGPFPPMHEYAQSLEDGSVGMLEYIPARTGAIALRGVDQQPNVGLVSSATDGCSASIVSWLPEHREINTTSDSSCIYQLRLDYFSFWNVFLDGKPVTASHGPTGLLQFDAPAGAHRVDVRFERPKKPFAAGAAVSGMTAIILAGLFFFDVRNRRSLSAAPADTTGSFAGKCG